MASKQWLWMGIGIMIAVFLNLIAFAALLPTLDVNPLFLGRDSIILTGLTIHLLLFVIAIWLIYRGMMAKQMTGAVSPQ